MDRSPPRSDITSDMAWAAIGARIVWTLVILVALAAIAALLLR